MGQGVTSRTLHRCGIGEAEVLFVAGDLLAQEVQGVVCYSSTSLTLHSAVAVQIVEQGGPAVRADAAKHLPARVGDALALSAGQLPMRYVLVAVTNELRTLPTIDSVRAAVRAALRRAHALGLDSIALPLLRVGRRLETDELLIITLVALFEHLCVGTSLRRVLLLLDEEERPARLTVQRIAPLLDTLTQVGSLQAQAPALDEIDQITARLHPAQHESISRELLTWRYETLRQVAQLLEAGVEAVGGSGMQGVLAELRYCEAELEQLSAAALRARPCYHHPGLSAPQSVGE
jgi:hypothetical protein